MKSFKTNPWILPQPVLVIGTFDKDGKPNAMNAAWGGQWSANKIMISMGNHATTENIEINNGEFTVAFATKSTAKAADYVGIVSAKKEPNKIAKTGWKVEKAPTVNAPIFTDFPLSLECKITNKLEKTEGGYNLIAEIVNIVADENYISEDGKPDVEKMQLIVFDPIHLGYIELGLRVGNAFSDGAALK